MSSPVKPIRLAARSAPGTSRRSSRSTPMPGRFSAVDLVGALAIGTPRASHSKRGRAAAGQLLLGHPLLQLGGGDAEQRRQLRRRPRPGPSPAPGRRTRSAPRRCARARAPDRSKMRAARREQGHGAQPVAAARASAYAGRRRRPASRPAGRRSTANRASARNAPSRSRRSAGQPGSRARRTAPAAAWARRPALGGAPVRAFAGRAAACRRRGRRRGRLRPGARPSCRRGPSAASRSRSCVTVGRRPAARSRRRSVPPVRRGRLLARGARFAARPPSRTCSAGGTGPGSRRGPRVRVAPLPDGPTARRVRLRVEDPAAAARPPRSHRSVGRRPVRERRAGARSRAAPRRIAFGVPAWFRRPRRHGSPPHALRGDGRRSPAPGFGTPITLPSGSRMYAGVPASTRPSLRAAAVQAARRLPPRRSPARSCCCWMSSAACCLSACPAGTSSRAILVLTTRMPSTPADDQRQHQRDERRPRRADRRRRRDPQPRRGRLARTVA